MLILKLKRNRLATVLTTIDPSLPDPSGAQHSAVFNFSKIAGKCFVIGPEEPAKMDGVRHIKTATPALNNLLATYLQSIPGSEVVMLTNPNVTVSEPNVQELLKYVDAQKMELAWATRVGPKTFLMSAQVVAHLLNDLPPKTTFASDWGTWVHKWNERLLRYRYFDGTRFNVIESRPEAVAETPPEVAPKRRKTIRKVKA